MKPILKIALLYAVLTSAAAHVLGLGILIARPDWVHKAVQLAMPASQPDPVIRGASASAQLVATLPEWRPLPGDPLPDGDIRIAGTSYPDLASAVKQLRDGDTLSLGPGVYTRGFHLRASGVTIEGRGHVVFKGAVVGGKGSFVLQGNNTVVRNIECYGVKVSDFNGACIRLEGQNLTLDHVYFHDSEQGVLAGRKPGTVIVSDSRFSRLGRDGRAHGIYVNGGELIIRDSQFLSSVDEGHEIKSRARRTVIERTIVASLGGNDSRLLDISDGGELIVRDSILEKGPASENGDLIGFGLEKSRYPAPRIELTNNIFLLDGRQHMRILHTRKNGPEPVVHGNLIIGKSEPTLAGMNVWLKDRHEGGLPAYPALPPLPKP